MRSTRVNLEQAVIEAARLVTGSYSDPNRGVLSSVRANDLIALGLAVRALDEHIEEITNERGGFNNRETSIDAANLSVPTVGHLRRRVIDEVYQRGGVRFGGFENGFEGMTCDEIERALKRAHASVSSAVNWLYNNGWLEDSGYRRKTVAGRDAIVWKLTNAARSKIASPEFIMGGTR